MTDWEVQVGNPKDLKNTNWAESRYQKQEWVKQAKRSGKEASMLIVKTPTETIAKGMLEHQEEHPNSYLWMLSVHPDWRGKGIGSAIIAKAEEITGAKGKKMVTLKVETTNTEALKLYQNLDYKILAPYSDTYPYKDTRGRKREKTEKGLILYKHVSET